MNSMLSAENLVAPDLPEPMTMGWQDPQGGTVPPLTREQQSAVRRYGAKAVLWGAAAAGVVALGTIATIKFGKWIMGAK